jgi:predicted ArsR family transcriptional regulator
VVALRGAAGPKVYEASGDGLILTVPERRYELIAEILADAVAGHPTDAETAAHQIATERGHRLGGQLRDTGADLDTVLAGLGFEPERQSDRVLLRNCPFHRLAQRQTALVCGINHAYVAGLVDGLAAPATSHLVPRADACCVEVRLPDER